MKQRPLTVEFPLAPTGTSAAPKPLPGARAERLRQEQAARKARNLALAYWIDHLILSGEVEDLAAVAMMCGVSRARISKAVGVLAMHSSEHEQLLRVTIGTGCCNL